MSFEKPPSTISLVAIAELGLEVGKEAYAVIKATSAMVGWTIESLRISAYDACESGNLMSFCDIITPYARFVSQANNIFAAFSYRQVQFEMRILLDFVSA